jgi:hypothetical protein
MGEGRKCTRFWWETPKERDHLKDRGIDGMIGLEWILREVEWGCGVDSPGSGWVPVVGCCECGDELSGSGSTALVI